MRRLEMIPRAHWQRTVEAQGLLFHSNHDGTPYWDETVCYAFSYAEIEQLEHVANELHAMFLRACQIAIRDHRLEELGIPESLHEVVSKSWRYDDWELYGRFDFTIDENGIPKLIEYNADTPTGLVEASLIQWHWKEALHPEADQFNSLHEALLLRWKKLLGRDQMRARYPLYLTSVAGHTEDRMTVGYMGEIAEQAGMTTRYIPINLLGWDQSREQFVDVDDEPIRQLFKLYPWEWLAVEPFSAHLKSHFWQVLEPPWKILCASKGMLLLLNELFPDHPNLLRVSRERGAFPSHVRKPFFGREGRNIELVVDGVRTDISGGPYQGGPVVYQEYCPLIRNGNLHAQMGVWMVGPEAHGMGIREDDCAILRNTSRFVPHMIV